MRIPNTPRSAFTLLEVLLSTAIGVLLLSALYVAVDIQYRHAQAARDVVEQSTLARALLNRMSNDIACSAGPADPSRFRASSSQGSGSQQQSGQQSGQTTGQQTTTDSTGTSGQQNTSSTTATDPMTSTSTSAVTGSGNFVFTLIGDSSRLSVFITRVPRELTLASANPEVAPGVVSDLRRISYWFVEGQPGGLAFEEIRPVTAEEASSPPPDIPADTPTSKILAEEVTSLSFSYFDGSSWVSEWDGTSLGSDGQTPIGPPLAVAIVISIAPPGGPRPDGVEPKVRTYRHVISLMTANGASQQTLSEELP